MKQIVKNVRPWGEDSTDIVVENGVITEVRGAGDDNGGSDTHTIDGRGLLALPGFINAHAHIDKTWWGRPWVRYGGARTTEGRIAHERAARDELGIPGRSQIEALIREMLRHGTTATRTHVDVDLDVGLRGIEETLKALEATGQHLDATVVAFAQDGLIRRPGVDRLLAEAAALDRVTHIGSVDPAGIDRDPIRAIDTLVDIAVSAGVGIDLHLHDGGSLGQFQFEVLAKRTIEADLQGKVTLSHGFALGELPQPQQDHVLELIAEAGISWATVAPANTEPLPLQRMRELGIPIGIGTDGIRDLWNPFGDGDMVRMAQGLAKLHGFRDDDELEGVMRRLTSGAALFADRPVHDLVPGAPADIVLIDAENPCDVLVRAPRRELVMSRGRVVVKAGEVVDLGEGF